jgi:hypothetical protein
MWGLEGEVIDSIKLYLPNTMGDHATYALEGRGARRDYLSETYRFIYLAKRKSQQRQI